MTVYFKALYDGQAGGEFTGEGTPAWTELTWTGGGRGQIILDIPNPITPTEGKLSVALIAGALPADDDVLTQGGVTANTFGAATTLLYPAYFRLDTDITDNASDKDIRWDTAGGAPVADGNGVIPTHSLYFDGQTVDLTADQILTFSGGQTAQLVNIIDQTGADGEIEVRFTSNLDAGLPVDGDTFIDEGTGDGTVQGEVHPRSYIALDLHRLLADLNDDAQFTGDDDISSLDPTPSAKDTDQIVRLIGGANIDDVLATHMYGGSILQASGATKYGGMDIQVTSPNFLTEPVVIQYDILTGLPAIVTAHWANAWNPDSIAGNVRIMRKIRENNVDIDGRRVSGKLLEFGDSFFSGSTTLGDATTSLALFASTDGNNQTAVGTVAGAPYNTVDLTEGFQTLNYNNGNGATDFSLSIAYDAASSPQTYEWTKYQQRRGTAESIFGLNGALVIGVNRNFTHDAETAAFVENQLMGWGTIVAYDTGTVAPFDQGESVSFSGGAVGRILLLDDDDPTGTMIVDVTNGQAIGDGENIVGNDSGALADTNDAGIVIEARSGTGWLIAYDDDGTTGNTYYQGMSGLDPVDNQPVYQLISETLESVDVDEPTDGVATRTINNQYVGTYTGTNFQTNFGIGIDPSDAILGDLNRNLLDVQQGVPNNQSGTVTNLVVGDRVWAYDWDGSTVDTNGDPIPTWDQFSFSGPESGASVATITIQEAISADTPQLGALRVTNDEGIRVLIAYTSWVTSTFTLAANYDFSGSGVNDSVADGNDVAIAYIDQIATSTQHSFTSIYDSDRLMAVRVLRGDNDPIVPSKASPTFSATGFEVAAGRISDA